MPYREKQMLRDANGDLIPQYWDVVEQDFKPLTGQNGANDVRLTGSLIEEVFINDEEILVSPGSAINLGVQVKGSKMGVGIRINGAYKWYVNHEFTSDSGITIYRHTRIIDNATHGTHYGGYTVENISQFSRIRIFNVDEEELKLQFAVVNDYI